MIVPGIAEAVAATRGLKILVCNLMTEPGETDGFGVAAHLEALRAHGLPSEALDYVVLNDSPIPQKVLRRYVASGAEPVAADFAVRTARPTVVAADLLESGPVVKHDPDKLGPLLCALAQSPSEDRLPSSGPRSHGTGVDPIAVEVTP